MSRRCLGSRPLGLAYLDGYRFVFRGHADVELSDLGDTVEGVLWEIDSQHIEALDALEGFPDYYLRHRVRVIWDGGEEFAWIYSMEDQSFQAGPSERYFTMCKEGYEHFGVNTDQLFDALQYDEKEIFNA